MVSPHDPGWASATHDPEPHSVYVYVWPQSVEPGDTLSVFISSVSPTVEVRFQRVGSPDTYVFDGTGAHHPGVPAGPQLVGDDAGTNTGLWSTGCGWKANLAVPVPASWASAPYLVEVRPENGEPSVNRQYAPFVVRDPLPSNEVCVVLATSTWWAYEGWGGKSLYDTPSWDRTNVASMQRPAVALAGRGSFGFRDTQWVRFLTMHGMAFDCITMEDIQRQGLDLLQRYGEIVFVGHSEYWSDAQRGAVEEYIGIGGNVFFGSGNVCWWRTEYSPDMTQLICYKGDNVKDADGGARGIPAGAQASYQPGGPHPLHPGTYLWMAPPAARPSNSLTGLNFYDAQAGAINRDGAGTPGDWMVRDATHWAFAGTGLSAGDRLGARWFPNDEVDGLPLDWTGNPYDASGVPAIRGSAYVAGTPGTFQILATAEANPFGLPHLSAPRWAVMGWYTSEAGGLVFTFPERNLGYELVDPNTAEENAVVGQIVRNVVQNLTQSPPSDTGVLDPPEGAGAPPPLLSIRQVFANPVSAASHGILFEVVTERDVTLDFDVFQVTGRRVHHEERRFHPHVQTLAWRPGGDVPDGVYYWRVSGAALPPAGGKIVLSR
jgi:hypothetical protein